MNSSQIFKLIFKHDLQLNDLAENMDSDNSNEHEASILDFMKPDPTYSKLHFSGTDLKKEEFGVSILTEYDLLISAIEEGLEADSYSTNNGAFNSLIEAIEAIEVNESINISPTASTTEYLLSLENESDIDLKTLLEEDIFVLHKIAAPSGFDLVLCTKENIYFNLFPHLHKLVPNAFRFFSINGKKFNTERHFYFETWALNRPPHGFEEVFPETVI